MPRRKDLSKVMVIGSGPIVIGQAAEFDYAGTQACRALQEEGIEVILLNSNPATIMTDVSMADRVYIEPLTAERAEAIIRKEKPNGLLPTLGGQVGLNLAVTLMEKGVLAREGVELLGTPVEAIRKAEDRELFKEAMAAIGQPVPESRIVHSLEEGRRFAAEIGYPVILRPAYTLGGTGGGMAHHEGDLIRILRGGLKYSPIGQVLIEKSVAGYKEVEYEVIRDARDNCISVCNMENLDPVGIHTGDSIVVAPSQTLTDREYQLLRSAAIKIIRSLGIEGGCNVQFALHPQELSYYIIEVNPRVSRSSALASKATGYPIARVATKIAVGLGLDEIKNPVTGHTYACFEPVLDYVVLKIPRWPFDKFASADRSLGTQMKATGEVMAIDRNFESALLKAIRSLDQGLNGLCSQEARGLPVEVIMERVARGDDQRLFLLAEAFRRGISPQAIWEQTRIDPFFLDKVRRIALLEDQLSRVEDPALLDADLLRQAKATGFSDAQIGALTGRGEDAVRAQRNRLGLQPVYKMVDTCAAEFDASTPYFYSTYEQEDEVRASERDKVLVLGSGPIRIGQGIEFDYCSVHAVWALRQEGVESLIINNNPETVSTDFNTSDRLYFEPLTAEDVLNVVEKERPRGIIAQFGGQTAINLVESLARAGVQVLGTPVEAMDEAEDREKFDRLLTRLGIPKPPGGTAFSREGAHEIAARIGYPVLVRPSYVLGGRAMEIVYTPDELDAYMENAVRVSPHHPVLVDKYLMGREIEVDAIADGENVLIPVIMEHLERAGVHSGDSIALCPARNLTPQQERTVVEYTTRLALALRVRGMINLQLVVHQDEVLVLEVNPRSSRTVPFVTKVTGIPLVNLATRIILGRSLAELGYRGGLYPRPPHVGVKLPVFSWAKLIDVDTSLGPEMKSTGEVMGIDVSYERALFKAFEAGGYLLPERGTAVITVADRDKEEVLPIAAALSGQGYTIYATDGTAAFLEAAGLAPRRINKLSQGSPHIIDFIQGGQVDLLINTVTRGRVAERDGFRIRRAAAEQAVSCTTSLDTAQALVRVLTDNKEKAGGVRPLQSYLSLLAADRGEGLAAASLGQGD